MAAEHEYNLTSQQELNSRCGLSWFLLITEAAVSNSLSVRSSWGLVRSTLAPLSELSWQFKPPRL